MAGFEVRVTGDLPRDILERLGTAVERAVLDEVAQLDIAPPLRIWPLSTTANSEFIAEGLGNETEPTWGAVGTQGEPTTGEPETATPLL